MDLDWGRGGKTCYRYFMWKLLPVALPVWKSVTMKRKTRIKSTLQDMVHSCAKFRIIFFSPYIVIIWHTSNHATYHIFILLRVDPVRVSKESQSCIPILLYFRQRSQSYVSDNLSKVPLIFQHFWISSLNFGHSPFIYSKSIQSTTKYCPSILLKYLVKNRKWFSSFIGR